jgi:hypothetical protein
VWRRGYREAFRPRFVDGKTGGRFGKVSENFCVFRRAGIEQSALYYAAAIENAAETLRAFIRVEDQDAGIVLTDGLDRWKSRVDQAAKEIHLQRFAGEYAFRITLGNTLPAPVTALSAVRAAWELAKELERLRAPVPQ